MTFTEIFNLNPEEIGPLAPTEETCLTCKYWKDAWYSHSDPINETNGVHWRYYSTGECRRYPPVICAKGALSEEDSYQQPDTESDMWCGEYQRDVKAKIGVAYHFPSGVLKELLSVDDWRIEQYQKQTKSEDS